MKLESTNTAIIRILLSSRDYDSPTLSIHPDLESAMKAKIPKDTYVFDYVVADTHKLTLKNPLFELEN
jgi:hypothetical protein